MSKTGKTGDRPVCPRFFLVLKYVGGVGQNIPGSMAEEVEMRGCADFERTSKAAKASGIEAGRIQSSLAGKSWVAIGARRLFQSTGGKP